jgi:hypothetical protein
MGCCLSVEVVAAIGKFHCMQACQPGCLNFQHWCWLLHIAICVPGCLSQVPMHTASSIAGPTPGRRLFREHSDNVLKHLNCRPGHRGTNFAHLQTTRMLWTWHEPAGPAADALGGRRTLMRRPQAFPTSSILDPKYFARTLLRNELQPDS